MEGLYHNNMDADKFEDWLATAKPGSRIEYYRGDLAYDREGTVEIGNVNAHVYREPLHSLGNAVWRAYRRNKVILYQTREDYGVFHYFAIKRRK